MAYMPHTPEDVRAMLATIGAASIDDLFASLPAAARLRRPLAIPAGLTEEEVRRRFKTLAARNRSQEDLVSFLGGGVYDSIIPAACDAISSRSEFLTAYTPYQAEVSQGTLQVIYEWQTFITRLTGLPVANASMYDGATALAEARAPSRSAHRRKTQGGAAGDAEPALPPRGARDAARRRASRSSRRRPRPTARSTSTRCAGSRTPTRRPWWCRTPTTSASSSPSTPWPRRAKAGGALLVACVNPVSLSLLKTPGEYGADLAVGEAQPFGVPCSFGGPLLGFFACSDALVRRMPGRIVGRTVDREGRDAYVLTLQTREQHIRREKATSNICSNQGLMALRACVYLAMLGGSGLRDLGQANRVRCEALRQRLARGAGRVDALRRPGVQRVRGAPAAPGGRLAHVSRTRKASWPASRWPAWPAAARTTCW